MDKSWTNGKPYYCKLCGAGYAEYLACEMPDCELETETDAQERVQKRADHITSASKP